MRKLPSRKPDLAVVPVVTLARVTGGALVNGVKSADPNSNYSSDKDILEITRPWESLR